MQGAVERLSSLLFSTDAASTAQVVTLNPELVVRTRDDILLNEAVHAAELVTADGVGIIWAAHRLCGVGLSRVAGVDLSEALMKNHGSRLSAYFLGGRPGVAGRAAEYATKSWGTQVVGAQDGYFQDEAETVARIRRANPQLLLVGMGEHQETFIHRHKTELGARVAIGVGGTLDVLAGEVGRMPRWTQRLQIEWLLRVGLDPRRWRRVPRLWRFILLVLRASWTR